MHTGFALSAFGTLPAAVRFQSPASRKEDGNAPDIGSRPTQAGMLANAPSDAQAVPGGAPKIQASATGDALQSRFD